MIFEKFLEYLRYERNYSVHTVFAYRRDLEQFAEFLCRERGKNDAGEVVSEDVRAWVISLIDAEGMKASSVHRKISSLHSYYKFLYVRGELSDNHPNPTAGVILPKKPKTLPSFFLEKEMDECLEMLENSSNFDDVKSLLIVEMIYQAGLRRSELTGLKDTDIDFVDKKMTIRGKGNKERVVPFGDDLSERILNYIRMRDEQQERKSDFLIVDRNGEQMKGNNVYSIVHRLMGRFSTQTKISPHVVRHTFATAMLNRGADLNVIKELLGHESLATTQIYTHVTFEQLQEVYKKSHPRGGE